MPKVLMYTASLEAKASATETKGYYKVDLDWNTSFTLKDGCRCSPTLLCIYPQCRQHPHTH